MTDFEAINRELATAAHAAWMAWNSGHIAGYELAEIDERPAMTAEEIEAAEEQYKADRLEEYRKEALNGWLELYREIMQLGGIRPSPDCPEIPTCLRRRNSNWTVDVVAAQFEMDVPEFVRRVEYAHGEWKRTETAGWHSNKMGRWV